MSYIEIYSSPLAFPINFAIHTWIVLHDTKKETLDRYDIHRWKWLNSTNNFFHNLQPIKQWMHKKFWKSIISDTDFFEWKLIKRVECDDQLFKNIKTSIINYPYNDTYIHYPWPNSNTFIQYIINKCNLDIKLPRNAIWKNYKNI
jgi:hypothetical protein